MDDNAPAHRGRIIRERLLETGVPQMEWPALSPDLNPIENLWDQLTHRVEARNSVPQNLNDLRAALQEEWDAMPQQTISRLVNSMRRRCQAETSRCSALPPPTFVPEPHVTRRHAAGRRPVSSAQPAVSGPPSTGITLCPEEAVTTTSTTMTPIRREASAVRHVTSNSRGCRESRTSMAQLRSALLTSGVLTLPLLRNKHPKPRPPETGTFRAS
ncbi:hypothetical protein SKAU_G00117910 [Synaphobranchus kaupii]|uniref:Tc1-like transposase DDE domain-containing protein n=1 Tax=Synaphobranchus kaupii TaxID=118154 RepID=A0A9Q1J273_SYNKA|nr:hypothetical protein SKAU_G00117910 [Synaphobranchus kaupii]